MEVRLALSNDDLKMYGIPSAFVISATRPAVSITNCSLSITQGRAHFEITFDHYEEVPDHVAKKVIEAAEKERAAAHS